MTKNTERQRYKYRWGPELVNRGSGDCMINFTFLLLEIRVDSFLTATSEVCN